MIIMFLLLIPVVIWLALKVAMCYSTELKLFDMLLLLTASLNQPLYLHLNEYSLKTILVFLFLYACGAPNDYALHSEAKKLLKITKLQRFC